MFGHPMGIASSHLWSTALGSNKPIREIELFPQVIECEFSFRVELQDLGGKHLKMQGLIGAPL